MKISSLPDFKSLLFTMRKSDSGRAYILAYMHQFIPEKHQSRIIYREHIGTLDEQSGQVTFSKKLLQRRPELTGKIYFYRNKTLVELSELDSQPKPKAVTLALNDVISVGASWSCWQTAVDHKILEDLQEVFPENGTKLLSIAIYEYLSGGSMSRYQQWLCNHWLPNAVPLSGQRISELLGQVTPTQMTAYFRKRFIRSNALKDGDELEGRRFLALDTTSISTYSKTIDIASHGHAKRDAHLPQINLVLGVSFGTGDVCYAYIAEGSINDRALYSSLIVDMKKNGFDVGKIILVTDRGFASLWNFQQLLNFEIGYICSIPLNEKAIRDLFLRYRQSFLSTAFWAPDSDLFVAAMERRENFQVPSAGGYVRVKPYLYLYRNLSKGYKDAMRFLHEVVAALNRKNKGDNVPPKEWRPYADYVYQSHGIWERNQRKLDDEAYLSGCFALRTNCVTNPFDCLRAYRDRNIVEEAFGQLKDIDSRLHATKTTYYGRIFVHIVAQSLRMIHSIAARHRESDELKLPENSLISLMKSLEAVYAVRTVDQEEWLLKTVPKKAREALWFLNIKQPIPKTFYPAQKTEKENTD